MKDNINLQELIDNYLMNKMPDDERLSFELEVSKDSELQKKVKIQRLIMDGFYRQGIINDIKLEVEKEKRKKKKFYRIIIFTASSAAIFLLIFFTDIFKKNEQGGTNHEYPDFGSFNYNYLNSLIDTVQTGHEGISPSIYCYPGRLVINRHDSIKFLDDNTAQKGHKDIMPPVFEYPLDSIDIIYDTINQLISFKVDDWSYSEYLNADSTLHNHDPMKSRIDERINYYSELAKVEFLIKTTQASMSQRNNAKNKQYNSATTDTSIYKQYMKKYERIKKLTEKEKSFEYQNKELIEESSEYQMFKSNSELLWKNISECLKNDEVAIEFINFINNKYKVEEKKKIYCALLLKHNSEPELIYLFEENQLDSLLADEPQIDDMYSSIYRVDEISPDGNTINPDNGKKLYSLIWEPIEKIIGNVNTIYYSPSGKLNLISFAALPDNGNNVLLKKYNLRQLTSTKEILSKTIQTEDVKKTALFGGINYGSSNDFGYLNRTKEEVENISQLLKNKDIGYILTLTDTLANESNFKMLSGKNYDIIHIAAHGFYIPQEKIKEDVYKDYHYLGVINAFKRTHFPMVINPLRSSGLVFAGANTAWTENAIPDNFEDGIMTSFEIAQMNLQQTKLVVLSACKTGMGDINGSDGAYGLQRAFKNAGVQTLIMNLWKVPDDATSKMMQLFYQYWLVEKMDKYDAFRKAQIETRKIFPDVRSWAGFVMID